MFSGLDSSVAGEIEGAFAQAGHVIVSNSRNYRMEADVPLLIPEVNADHLALLKTQAARAAGRAASSPTRTASSSCYAMALAPLRQFGLKTSIITTLQAISGAGYPGVRVVGHSRQRHSVHRRRRGREDRNRDEQDPRRAEERRGREPSGDGQRRGRRACRCTTGTPDRFRSRSSSSPIRRRSIAAWNAFRGKPQELGLPSAPPQPIVYLTEPNRPQPALDANRDGGMTVTVGRLRRCPVLDYKFVALGHNTIRGAAGAAILNAELMHREGLL